MSVVYYNDYSSNDYTVKRKEFRKKKSGDLLFYAVLTLDFRTNYRGFYAVWLVEARFETRKNGKVIDSEILSEESFEYRGDALDAYDSMLDRVKHGTLELRYKFTLAD